MDSAGLEIEAKFYISDLPKIEGRLRSQGGRLIQPRTLEENYRFDTSAGDLHPAKRVLRLRKDRAVRLTYKAAGTTRAGVSARRELETAVENLETARAILEELGYRVVFYYEKYRTIYALDGTHVMLDELPYGNFLEIEGEDGNIRATAEKLGLAWSAVVTAGYHALYERLCAIRPLNPSCLAFDAMRGMKISPAELAVSPADV